MADHKGGRPRIGTPVSITLPDDELATVDGMAAARGVTRSRQLRDIVSKAVADARDIPEPTTRSEQEVAPVVSLLVQWIGENPGDGDQIRERFIALKDCLNSGHQLTSLIERAWGHLYLNGRQDLQMPQPDMVRRLGDRHEWQLRGAYLWVGVLNGLVAAGLRPTLDTDQGEDFSPEEPEIAEEYG